MAQRFTGLLGTAPDDHTGSALRVGGVAIQGDLTELFADIAALGTLSTQNGTFSGTSSGTNTGDQTITLTGDVTGSGTGSFAASVVKVNGAAVPTSAQFLSSNGSNQLAAGTFGAGITSAGALDLTYAATKTAVDTHSITLAANTSGDGLVLSQPTAATAANQRFAPRLHFTGSGWATTPVAAQSVDWIIEVQPVQGSANPTSNLVISSATNGGAYSTGLTLTSGGGAANTVTFNGGVIAPSFRATGATLPIAGIYSTGSNVLSFASNSAAVGSFDGNKNFIHLGSRCDQSKSVQAPTTGFTITIANNISTLILNPAGTLATGTITMPATPIDGQEVQITSSQTITGLTVSPNTSQTISNAPTTLTAGIGYKFIYHLAGTNWYRLH